MTGSFVTWLGKQNSSVCVPPLRIRALSDVSNSSPVTCRINTIDRRVYLFVVSIYWGTRVIAPFVRVPCHLTGFARLVWGTSTWILTTFLVQSDLCFVLLLGQTRHYSWTWGGVSCECIHTLTYDNMHAHALTHPCMCVCMRAWVCVCVCVWRVTTRLLLGRYPYNTHTHTDIPTYIHTHSHTHTHTHIHTHALTHTETYPRTHTRTHTHTDIPTYIHSLTHTHTHTHVCVYRYAYTTHTHTKPHTYTRTHTHMYVCVYTHMHTLLIHTLAPRKAVWAFWSMSYAYTPFPRWWDPKCSSKRKSKSSMAKVHSSFQMSRSKRDLGWPSSSVLFSNEPFEKRPWMTTEDFGLHSDDHFEFHLLGNGLYTTRTVRESCVSFAKEPY